jgi:hypothetical protein
MLHQLSKNLQYAARRLAQRPGFTLVAVLSLALGIGANSAIFSLVNAVLLRRAPLEKPEELVEIYISSPEFEYNVFSYPDLRTSRRTKDVSPRYRARSYPHQLTRLRSRSAPAECDGNYFPPRHRGRRPYLLPETTSPGAHPVVMLGHNIG